MRILAIRGKNLASLAREFEVDFTREPLATTGIFAITGPTGAGKSTLLDALCLALYDDTPRLLRANTARGISLPDVQGETLAARDSRSILRRGATEGFTEVDFVGSDGIAYRARWSTRRARNKAGGKLQAVDMSLLRIIDQQPIGGALKSEVLPAIRERVGLNFDQFTRAVLLAQNEFASFLKASDDERAGLLETLTGTDQFATLSRRAFERAKQERLQLQTLLDQAGHLRPLAPDARSQLETEVTAARQTLDAEEARKATLEQQLRWHQQWQGLQRAEQAAATGLEQAQAEQTAAGERRALLEQLAAVQTARPLLLARDRSHLEVSVAQTRLEQATGQLQTSTTDLQAATAEQTKLAEALAAAEQARQQAAPELTQARALDIELVTLQPGYEAAEQALQAAQADLLKAGQQHTQKTEELQQVTTALAAAEHWLGERTGWQVLAERWGEWRTLLGQAGQYQQETEDLAHSVQALHQQQAQCQQAHDQANQTLEQQDAACQQAEQALSTAKQALAQFDHTALSQRRQQLESQREQLNNGQTAWQAFSVSQARQQVLTDKIRRLQVDSEAGAKQLQQALAEQPLAQRALQQAERSLQLAEAACHAEVESLRAALEADVPCPVCGALQHPYAEHDPRMRAVLDGLQVEVRQQRKAVKTLDTAVASQQAQLNSLQAQVAEREQELQALQHELQAHTERWQAHVEVYTQSSTAPADHDWSTWFVQQLAMQRTELQTLQAEEQAAQRAQTQREQAQQQRQQAAQLQTQAKDTLSQALLALRQTGQELRVASQQQASTEARLQAVLTQLQVALAAGGSSDWMAVWRADPVGFVALRQAEAQQWQAQQLQKGRLEQQIATLEVTVKNLRASQQAASQTLQTATHHFARLDQDLQVRRARRQAFFAGRAVSVVEQALDGAIARSKAALATQQALLQAAQAAQVRASESLRSAQSQLEASRQQLAQAGQDLAGCLQGLSVSVQGEALTEATLRTLLEHDADWIKAETRALQALEMAVNKAQTLWQERQLQSEQHARLASTTETLEQVAAQQQAVNDLLSQAQAHWQELQLALRQDEERRAQSARLQVAIDAQESARRVWEQLNELIGSADGKKFRNVAQQYSLDVLLSYTNRHLTDLSRRYVLQRVPESLALLVLDQDMGDEARSVHSLSGGESFLVSLALALGLASLSSQRVRVESLFIDEGFGSLDADSLRIALDALDKLQAQGRKVGVISHVQEMTERIGVQIQIQRQAGGQSRVVVL